MRRPYSCFRAARKRTKPPGDCPAHCVPRGDALRGGNRAGATYLYIIRTIDNNAPPVLLLPRGEETNQAAG